MKRIEIFNLVMIAGTTCVSKPTNEKIDHMLHWKCKTYVIKIVFNNEDTFLLMIPFRLLFLVMSTIRCNKKIDLGNHIQCHFFGQFFFYIFPPIQRCRMLVR
jgi:hypothetical protein